MTIITFEVIVPALIFLLALLAFSTQLVIPLLRGSAIFTALRHEHLELVDELQQVDQEIQDEHLRHELALKRKQLETEKGHID